MLSHKPERQRFERNLQSKTGLTTEIAVVTAYYNPCGYKSRLINFKLFWQALAKQGVPAYAAEVAYGSRKHELPPGDHILHLRARDVMWQKEAIINLLVVRVPPQYRKIAWVDADVVFGNDSWHVQAVDALEQFELVQPFGTAEHLGPHGEVLSTTKSVAKKVLSGCSSAFDFRSTQPGLAWAARRDFLESFGLFDRMIVGGADLIMALAAYGCCSHSYLDSLPPKLRDCWRAWSNPFWDRLRGRVGCTNATIAHLWHGSQTQRFYTKRLEILREHAFDPDTDVALRSEGLLSWATPKFAMHEAIHRYFFDRREDN